MGTELVTGSNRVSKRRSKQKDGLDYLLDEMEKFQASRVC